MATTYKANANVHLDGDVQPRGGVDVRLPATSTGRREHRRTLHAL
jgi:hypothetical protein